MTVSMIAEEIPRILAESSKKKLSYNVAFRAIFSQRAVLAMILRDCVGGYGGMELWEIERHIVRGPFASEVPVAPGLTTAPSSPLGEAGAPAGHLCPTGVAGGATEDFVPNEGVATFDFYFEATVPGEEGLVAIHVDVEGQARFKDKYAMVNRAQFYCARLLSSQYGREFMHQEYDKLKRVFSVWFFVDAPKELRGSIMATRSEWVALGGAPRVDPGPIDLMTVVFAFMDDETGAPRRGDVVGLLETMFEKSLSWHEKRSIIEESYGITTAPGLEAASMVLSEFDADMIELRLEQFMREGRQLGFKEGYDQGREEGREAGLLAGREEGLAEGIAEGREAGIAEGREAGIAEGREAGLAEGEAAAYAELAKRLVDKLGYDLQEALDFLEVPAARRARVTEFLTRS